MQFHFVDIHHEKLTPFCKDEDVPWIASDSTECHGLAIVTATVLVTHSEQLWLTDRDASSIVCVPESESTVCMQSAQPENASVEDAGRGTSHHTVVY